MNKIEYKSFFFCGIAVVVVMVVCLCVLPVKNMLKISALTKDNGFDTDSSDLLYREIEGESISLEKGDRINLLVENEKEFKDVCICLVGKDDVWMIGKLDSTTSYSFTADFSGEYVIYEMKNEINITDELVIEYLNNIEGENLIPMD